MKNIKYLFATIVLGLALTSCGDSFLTQYPEGGVLLQDQYDGLSKAQQLEGAIKGIYSKMYEYGGEHDAFGQRAIDMYGDIQSGDMAMKKCSYGWFDVYERGQFRQRLGLSSKGRLYVLWRSVPGGESDCSSCIPF